MLGLVSGLGLECRAVLVPEWHRYPFGHRPETSGSAADKQLTNRPQEFSFWC